MKLTKKILSAVIAGVMMLTMCFSNLLEIAGAIRVNAFEFDDVEGVDFDMSCYVADLMLNPNTHEGNNLNYVLDLEMPSKKLVDSINNQPGFMASINAWQVFNFKPSKVGDSVINDVTYYQAIIFQIIGIYFKSDVIKSTLGNEAIQNREKIFKTFKNLLEVECSYDDEFINNFNAITASSEDTKKIMDTYKEAFEQTYPDIKDVSDKLKIFDRLLKTGQTLEKCIGNFVSFIQCAYLSDYVKAVISDMSDKCDGNKYPAMKTALAEVKSASDGLDSAIETAILDSYARIGAVANGLVLDEIFTKWLGSTSFGKGVLIGQALGNTISNWLFSTDKTCESTYKMIALVNVEELLQTITKYEINNYKSDRTAYKANIMFSAIEMLLNEYNASCDYAISFMDSMYKDNLWSYFADKTKYNANVNACKEIKQILKRQYEDIEGDFLYSLQIDHPDIYEKFYEQHFANGCRFIKNGIEYEIFVEDDYEHTNQNGKVAVISNRDNNEIPKMVRYYNKFYDIDELQHQYVPEEQISVTGINVTEDNVELNLADMFPARSFMVNIAPYIASNKKIIATSSDENVVHVKVVRYTYSEPGITLLPRSTGTATVTVKSVDGDFTDTIDVTVIDSGDDNKPEEQYNFTYEIINNEVTITGYQGNFENVGIPQTIKGYPVTSIADETFKNNYNIKFVLISEGIKSIGNNCFENSSIVGIDLPSSITSIGSGAFKDCHQLEQIDLPSNIEEIKNETFYDCRKLENIVIPPSVKTIGEYAFRGCNGLKNVTLSEGLETIGKYAFCVCCNIEEITIPNSTVTIDRGAFGSCLELKTVVINGGEICGEISSGGFAGGGAFEGCHGLKDIWIGDNVTSIGFRAFDPWDCISGDSIGNFDEEYYRERNGNAPKLHINSIASWCNIKHASMLLVGIGDLYLGEDLITDLIIPDGVKKINAYAFRGGSFKTITLPESVEIIENHAFAGMRNLERITIKNKNCEIASFSIYNDNHFIKGNERTECNNMNFTLYGYSDSTALSYALERGCKFELLDRNSITIEPQNGVSEYDNRISWSLDANGTLTISGTGKIYESPWREGNENKIRKVIIGDGITVIHTDAFKNCYELKEVILPDSIEEIDGEAFMSCVNLDNIVLPQNLKRLNSLAFDKTAIIEKQITRFRYIGDWLVKIQKRTTSGLQYGVIYSIIIPNDVIRIASNTVYGEISPDRVETITIPANVKYLSGDSFWGCNSLKSITILNPNCKIDDVVNGRRGIICTEVYNGSSLQTTQFKGTIYGYSGSTAERLAQKYGYAFSSLGESPYPLEPVEEEPQSQEDIPSQYDPQNLCTISFNMQGHGGRIADSKIPKGARDLDLSSLTMLSAGYTFGGWYKDQNCTDGQEFTIPIEINESFTLYAKWIANKYKVSFNKNAEDAIGTMTDQTLTYDTAQNLTTNGFTRTGYTFKGWAKSNSATTADYTDGQSVNNLTEENNGTVNLYAVWKANTYTVKFNKNANDVTGEMANQSFTYDSTKNLAANVFTRTGYTFKGWAKSNRATTADYTDRQNVNNLTDDNNGLVNLYAVWEANTYMITYVLNGGTNPDEAPVTYTYGIGATLPIPTKTGYTFNGWYSNGQFSGDAVTAISATESKNKVFNAKWTANTYTVKFNKNANDATGEMANQSFTYDSTKNLATNVFTRTGYAFLGWSKSNTATTATYTDKADVKNLAENGTVNLYAVWKEGSNNVTFNSKGGSNVISAIVINGGKVTKPDDPTRSGYTFGGWFTDDACTTEFDFDTEITESITLYAKWTANSSPVTYDTVTEGDITYHIHDSYAEVYECSTNVETATIKSSVNGVSVKRIGENAFNSCTKLKTVNIPASVTEIGTNAFWGCASLESLTIPKTVTIIGKDIFSHCDKFSKIYGYRNSAAERYATANSLTFVALDGEAVTTSSSTTTGSSATTTTTTTTTSANAAASTAAAPARPTNVVIDNSGVVTWNKAENAVEYKVFKKVGDNTSHSGWVKGTSYKFGSVPNENFEIYVAARNSDGSKTSWSDHVNVTVAKPLGTPTNVSVDKNGKVTWTKAANATSYKVVTIVNGISRGGDVVKTNSATIEVPATNYQVYVAAFGENGTKKISEKIDVTVENALGVVNDVTIDKDGNVSWQVAENAVAYKVGKVVNGYTYYTDKLETTTAKIKPATKDYQVFIVAFDKDGKTTWGKKNLVEVGNLGTVLDPKVDANGNVTWTAARNAVKYKVGKIVNGTTYYTGDLTTNSTTISVPKSDYKVFVVAFDKDGNKTWGTKVDVR